MAATWVMLILVVLAKFITDGFVCAGTSPLLPFAAEEMHLSHAQVSSIWGAMPLGMLVTAILGGVLADRLPSQAEQSFSSIAILASG